MLVFLLAHLPCLLCKIPRILNPIAETVHALEEMAVDPVLGHYVDVQWGGVHNAKMAILSDYFKVWGCIRLIPFIA